MKLHRRDFIAFVSGAASAGTVLAGPTQKHNALPAQRAADGISILVIGDSLSAEYGLARGTGWVALLEKRLAIRRPGTTVVNASISGDTTAGGRARLPLLLKENRPDVVVIELGGNDALRGMALASTEANLVAMISASQQGGAAVLLLGMEVPPNYGGDYTRRFAKIFQNAAHATNCALVPFFLEGVANGPDASTLFQADRIHPLARAHPRLLDNVWPGLQPLLKKQSARVGRATTPN